MFAVSNESLSVVAVESRGSGEEAMLIDLDQDLLHWNITSVTIIQRARRYNATLRQRVGALLGNEEGAIAIWLSIGLTGLLGFAALAVDVGSFHLSKNQLQIAADTAARGAVSLLPDETAARAAAVNYAAMNLPPAQHGTALQSNDVLIGNWDADAGTFTDGASPLNAVQVVVRRTAANGNPVGAMFGQVLNIDSVDVISSATAVKGSVANCLLALDSSSAEAVKVDSNAGITASGCGITVNSTSSSALSADSNATISVDGICVAGDYSEASNSHISPEPTIGCDPVSDPLASLSAPSYGGCDENGLSLDNYSGPPLAPGVYCGGLEIKNDSTVVFDSGVYVITGGDLLVDSNAAISGAGVSFFFADGASIQFDSHSSVDFTASTTGSLAGILFFQDRGYETEHVFDSNNVSRLEGTVYLPTSTFRSDSNTQIGTSSAYSIYIAKRFALDSNADLIINADHGSSSVPLPSGLAGSTNRLVM